MQMYYTLAEKSVQIRFYRRPGAAGNIIIAGKKQPIYDLHFSAIDIKPPYRFIFDN